MAIAKNAVIVMFRKMICRELNLLFVHVPKTAGQAMEEYFLNLLGMDWKKEKAKMLCRKNRWPWKGPTRLAHLTAQEYLKYGYLNEEDFEGLFKCVFVRNPWARLVSEFEYAGHAEKGDFKSWLLERFPTIKEERGFFRSGDYRHVMPQTDYILDVKGEVMVDFVGKFENIAEDFSEVCRRMEIKSEPLPKKNVGKKKRHYSEYYEEKTRKFVSEKYALEIEMFDYSYEG